MTVLVVGSVALDSVETPFGKADDVLGGSGTFLLRIGEPLHAGAARRRGRQRLSGRQARAAREARRRPRRARARRGRIVPLARPLPPRSQLRRDARDAPRRVLALPPEDPRRSSATRRSSFSPTSIRACSSMCCDQVEKPKLVACDTMNFWIESRRADLLELLEHVDLITLNDGEARQLTEESNLVKAARWIMKRGPRHVVIKKGEHGAFMFTRDSRCSSRRRIRSRTCSIPTGAGDSFAGGFMGYLARTGDARRRATAARRGVRLAWARSPSSGSRSSGCSRSVPTDIRAALTRVPTPRRVRGGAAVSVQRMQRGRSTIATRGRRHRGGR